MIVEKPASGVRWTICALIFFATTVNYLDRQLFSQLVPYFQDDLKLGPNDLALINVSFVVPYGLAMLFVGQYIDRVGIRRGLSRTFLIWNVASMGHAFVRGLGGFMGVRFLLGIGESGMFPAAVKTMTEWFPVKERSFSTGLFNAGANFGAILGPLLGIWLANTLGWRMCFVVTGCIGLIWLFFWNRYYRPPGEHPKVSESELAYIRSDGTAELPSIGYSQLFGIRSIYGLSIAKALTDAPWWFYLTWMPKFLVDQFKVNPTFTAFAIPVIYIVADVGSVAGGWMSSRLIQRGLAVGPARKLAMLTCALAVVPVMSVGSFVDHAPIAGIPCVYWAVAVVALAAGAHQGWSCNLFTLVSDTVPKNAVGMAVGAINGFAMVGVSAMQFFVGRTVQVSNSYTLPFMVSGGAYLTALVILQLMLPRVEPDTGTRRARMPLVLAGVGVTLLALFGMQYTLNKPPYASLQDYLTLRGAELHATANIGPTASVGWMQSVWVLWTPAIGKPKLELVKFDTKSHPFIEPKGTRASEYLGPGPTQLDATFHLAGS
jgi:ACS family hexuronate transporter-like MFS transporter